MTRFVCAVLVSVAVCGGVSRAQSAQPASDTKLATLLQPSMGKIEQTLPNLQPDKWKLSNQWKQQIAGDLTSIQRDLENTLPGLVTTADNAPGSISSALSVSSNVDALYDVLLRVAEKAQLTAPDNQTMALGQALQSLADARKTLDGRLRAEIASQEKQVKDLRASMQTQTAQMTAAQQQVASLQAAAAAPCTPAKSTAKKKVVAKAATKPATTAAKPAAGTPAAKPAAGTPAKP